MSRTSEPGSIDRSQADEDYPLSAVPPEARQPILSLAPLLISFTLYSGNLWLGEIVGSAYRFWPDLIRTVLLGNLLVGVYAAAIAYIAANSGLNTVLMARFSFGNLGSRWVDLILGIPQILLYAWGSSLIAQLINQVVGLPLSFNWLIIIFFTYAFCTTAYMGYLAMDWFSRLAVPVMVILLIWSLSIAAGDAGGFSDLQAIIPQKQLSLEEAITLIFGVLVSGATQATNFSRFASNGRQAAQVTLLAFFLGNSLLIFCGACYSIIYGTEQIVQVMTKQELLVWGLAFLFLNMWTSQDKIIYSFSLAGANLFRTKKRNRLVFVGVTIALFLAWGGIDNPMTYLLKLFGTLIPPIGGVIMADYWLHYQGKFPSLQKQAPAYNRRGLLSYVIACAIAWYVPGIKPINGMIAAAVLYSLMLGKNRGGDGEMGRWGDGETKR
ncbi:MAG: cytosine permease [Symploca sp. SIO2E9]|nr:cytosine permease [Symploca sp. SIO2E9]